MSKRPKPVRDFEDAITWLSYWSRFTTGDMSRNMAGILDVMLRMDFEAEELRARLVGMAKANEIREARGGEGL